MLLNNNTPSSPCEHRRKAFKIDISHFDDKVTRSKYPPITEKTLISPMSTTLQSTSLRQSSTFQIKLDSCFFKFKSFLLYILHHSITNITVFTLSLIVIFLHDINALISTGTYDTLVDAVYCIVLVVFVCEFTAKSVALSGYVLSALFFLDMLSLIGMALEIRNHCVMIADLLVKEKIDERYLNSNQINVYVSLTKLAQIMKSTLVIKVYNFIQNVRKKMEVNARMKELQRMINEKEHKKYCNSNDNKKGKLSPNRNNNNNISNCATINNSNSNTKKNKMSCLQSPRDSYPYNVGGIDINKCNNNNLNNSNNMNNSNINNSSLDNNYISCTPISFSSFSNFVNTNTNKPNNNEVKPIIPNNTNINVPSPLITNPNILSIGAVPTTNYIMNTSQSNFLNTNNNNESIPPISISNLLQNNNTNINNNIPPIHNTNSNNNANFLHLHSRMSKIYDYYSYLSSRTGYFSTTQNQINNTNNTTTTPFITTTNFNSILHSNMRRKNSECEDMHENALIQLNKINLYKQRKRFELENESQISKIVTKNISDKSLLLILLILFLFPLFNEDNFITSSDTTSYEYICEQVDQQYILHNGTLPKEFLIQINTFIRDHINDWGRHIIMLNHSHYSRNNGVIYINDTFRSSSSSSSATTAMLRSNEIAISSIRRNSSNNVDHSTHAHTYIKYSIRYLVHIMCIIDIVRNVCLFVILYTFSYKIFEDTKTNILTPLEITTNTVNIVAKDPVNFQSLEKLNQSIMNYTRKKKTLYSAYNNNYLNSQIKTIQFSIIRICKLMAIGFGEAGGQILRDNMNSFEGLNPMLPGKKISGIFGFCLIRNFSQINEALQEKTILFVNEIASIVHTNVQKFGGVCNKNIGESFLLIWKFNTPSSSSTTKDPVTLLDEIIYSNRSTSKQHKEHLNEQNTPNTNTNTYTYTHKQHIINSQQETNNNNSLSNINSNEKNLLADSAVMAFLAVIKKITKSRISDKYENDAQLQKITLTPSCMNNNVNNSSNKYKKFKIKMGFGLHVGWGVEGAIGSYHKIDCSYLSPNVNIAARLETATNIYGVEMLFSGEIYNLMSNSLQRKCRLIDCVTLKGSVTPVKLYTIDVNKSIPKGKSKQKKMSDKEKRAQNEYKKTQMFDDMKKYDKSIDIVYMDKSKGMRNLLKNPKSEVFLMCFKKGYDNYIKGNWNKAYSLLKQALFIDWNDGPTNALIKYIEKFNCKAPEDWKGYRALSSKF